MIYLPILIIALLSIMVCRIFNVNIAKALPFTICSMTLIVYISGFFNNLLIGYHVLIIFVIISIIYLFYDCIINHNTIFIKSIFYDCNLYLFLLFSLIIIFYNINKSINHIDEINFWEPFVNDLYQRNRFYFTEGHIATTHLSYPPFLSIIQYIFCKFSGTYIVKNLYIAKQIFQYTLGFYILSVVDSKIISLLKNRTNILKYIISILIVAITYNVYSYEFYKLLLVDGLVGLIFAYSLMLIYTYDKTNESFFEKINIVITLSSLILTKQIGIFFYCLFILISIIILFYRKMLSSNKRFIASYIVVPILLFAAWVIYSRISNTIDQFDLDKKMNLFTIFEIIFCGKGLPYQQKTIKNFINLIFFENTYRYINIVIFYIFAIFAFAFLYYFISKEDKKKYIVIIFLFLISFIGYLFSLLCLYLFCFSIEEAVELACAKRYILTYVVAIAFIWNFLFIYYFNNSKKNISKYVMAFFDIACFIILLFMTDTLRFIIF